MSQFTEDISVLLALPDSNGVGASTVAFPKMRSLGNVVYPRLTPAPKCYRLSPHRHTPLLGIADSLLTYAIALPNISHDPQPGLVVEIAQGCQCGQDGLAFRIGGDSI